MGRIADYGYRGGSDRFVFDFSGCSSMRLFRRFIIPSLPKSNVKETVRHIVCCFWRKRVKLYGIGCYHLNVFMIYESLSIFGSDLSQRETRACTSIVYIRLVLIL